MQLYPEFPNIAEDATTADLYNRAVEIGVSGDSKLASKYFHVLVDHVMKHSIIPHITLEKAEAVVYTNIEYWLQHHEVDPEPIKSMYLLIMRTPKQFDIDDMEEAYNMGKAQGPNGSFNNYLKIKGVIGW